MAKTQELTKTKNNTQNLKKLTAMEAKLEVGETVRGFFLEMKEVDQMNPETGESRTQTKIYMEETKGGDRFFIWGNAGLKSAVIDSCVSKGDHIMIERLEKKALKGGRTKNQYDIFQVQE